MSRQVEELTLEELERLVEDRRRIEAARRFAEAGEGFQPITVEPVGLPRRTWVPHAPRNWRERALLGLEVLALVALVGVILGSLLNLQAMNQETALTQKSAARDTSPANPDATVVLPGASYPPADADRSELPGSSSPPAALPASLGVTVQQAPALPVPTPGPRSPTRIVIPAIKVDWPIVQGDSWEDLKAGVGHHIGSANPGERGNVVLTGHDDVYGEVFRDLETLSIGETVWIYAGGHAFKYVVRAKRVVAPSDLTVLKPTREATATLITCTPYMVDTMRLIVIAELVP